MDYKLLYVDCLQDMPKRGNIISLRDHGKKGSRTKTKQGAQTQQPKSLELETKEVIVTVVVVTWPSGLIKFIRSHEHLLLFMAHTLA